MEHSNFTQEDFESPLEKEHFDRAHKVALSVFFDTHKMHTYVFWGFLIGIPIFFLISSISSFANENIGGGIALLVLVPIFVFAGIYARLRWLKNRYKSIAMSTKNSIKEEMEDANEIYVLYKNMFDSLMRSVNAGDEENVRIALASIFTGGMDSIREGIEYINNPSPYWTDVQKTEIKDILLKAKGVAKQNADREKQVKILVEKIRGEKDRRAKEAAHQAHVRSIAESTKEIADFTKKFD
jgi:hypothetical protein